MINTIINVFMLIEFHEFYIFFQNSEENEVGVQTVNVLRILLPINKPDSAADTNCEQTSIWSPSLLPHLEFAYFIRKHVRRFSCSLHLVFLDLSSSLYYLFLVKTTPRDSPYFMTKLQVPSSPLDIIISKCQ